MFKRFARLAPYIRRNRGSLALGAIALVLANFFDVQVLVLLGVAIDALGWNLGVFEPIHGKILGIVLWAIIALALAGAMARFWMRWLIIGVSREVEFDLRAALFAHLQRLSPSFFQKHPTGDLMARATNDLEAVRLLIGPAVMYLSGTAVMVPFTLYQMIRISGMLTLITWVPMLFIIPLFYVFSHRIHDAFMKSQQTFSAISTRVQETLTGIRVIKANAAENHVAGRFVNLSQKYIGDNVLLTKYQALFIPLLSCMIGVSLLALVWGGSWMIIHSVGGMTPGRMIAFFVLMMANIWPLAAIGWVFSLMERGSASMQRINALFEIGPDVVDADNIQEVGAPMRGHVQFKHLTFTYPTGTSPALHDINVDLPAGDTLGLTGPVGCGKSTIAQLLTRRFNPPRGTIEIDGRDILDWPLHEYRGQVAIVDQEPFVFSDTLRENVAYGKPEVNGTAVEDAADTAQLTKDLEDLPDGLDTIIGERGINLSGGQRQRAALARAIATDPSIIILDDSLSAVDTHTEEEILRGLTRFMQGRTTILISHRISTVSITDRILYMEDGRIVEEGTHDELMTLGGKYWSLARRQQLAEEIEATA